MANNCFYHMRVMGSKEGIGEFLKVMTDYNHTPHFWRVFSAEVSELEPNDDGTFTADINGDCAWSVHSCMRDGHGTYAKDRPQISTSLKRESKRLRLEIEVFAEEPGIGFQEHYRYKNGKELANEVENWDVYMFEEDEYNCESREAAFACFLKEYGLTGHGFTLRSLRLDNTLTLGGLADYCDFAF